MEADTESRILNAIDVRIASLERLLDEKFGSVAEAIRHGDAQSQQAVAGLRALYEQNANAIERLRQYDHDQGIRIGEIDARVRDTERDIADMRHHQKSTDAIINAERNQRVENTEWRHDIQRDLNRVTTAAKLLVPANIGALTAILYKLYGG